MVKVGDKFLTTGRGECFMPHKEITITLIKDGAVSYTYEEDDEWEASQPVSEFEQRVLRLEAVQLIEEPLDKG